LASLNEDGDDVQERWYVDPLCSREVKFERFIPGLDEGMILD